MATTRGGLVPATLKSNNGIEVECMFNPEKYTITKENIFKEIKELPNQPNPEFQSFALTKLTLSTLYFDTYETGENLKTTTDKLWKLMKPKDENAKKKEPPDVTFKWGDFEFTAVVENITMDFTLFDKDGVPLRAEVKITFKASEQPYPKQNPTSGDGPIQDIRRVIKGDRLDLIAADVYGDATKWRYIAEYNQINNPRQLRPGQMIAIPPL